MSIHETIADGNGHPVESLGKSPTSGPHNLEAEQAVIGALLLNNSASEYVADLTAGHFYDPLHGQIFAAITDALEHGRAVSPVTLAERFRHVQVTPERNGAQYLGYLAANATSIRHARDYARTVIECAQRRQLILIAEEVSARAYNPAETMTPAAIIEDAERQLFHAAGSLKTGREMGIAEAVKAAVASALRAHETGDGLAGVKTGFLDIDRKVGGLGNGNLIILAARPAMGKTALALNIASNVAQAGDAVHFFSLEMSPEELANRQLGDVAEISSDRIRRGDFTSDQFRAIHKAAERIAGLPVHIDATGGISISTLATKARRRKRKHNTKLLIVDYLQLMTAGTGRGGNRVQDVTEITTGLKALAKDLDIPIIALSQLNRGLESRPDKRPQLADLRESGSIEQDADVVLFVYRDEYYVEKARPDPTDDAATMDWQRRLRDVAGKAEIIVSKQRHGSTGIIEMAFQGEFTRFSDLARTGAP